MARPGRLLAIWLLTLPAVGRQALAQDWSGHVRLQLGQEYDSNAVRENSPTAPDDFLARLVVQGVIKYTTGAHRLWLDFQGGGKTFYQEHEEHQLATRLQAGVRWALPDDRSAGVRMHLRDVTQARHSRDYMQIGGDLFLRSRDWPGLVLEAWLGGRRYDFKPDGTGLAQIVVDVFTADSLEDVTKEILYSNAGPEAGLQLYAQLGDSWSLNLAYRFGVRFFADDAYRYLAGDSFEATLCRDPEGGCFTPTGSDRQDIRNTAGLSLRLETAWWRHHQLIAQVSYTLTHNSSNSVGNSAIWHRFRAVLSAQLPFDLTLHLMGTVQVTNYPDGRNLLQDFYEPDADENENTFVARLSWRLVDELSLIAQAAIYRNDFQFGTAAQPAFQRETYLIGLAWDAWF